MKWKKLGRIFNPVEHKLINNCIEFAQSPQTLVFDDFVRIYFSTRETDPKNGKFLSHVAYVEMSKDFKNILNNSSKTVIPLGELGTFDEHGIFPINILKEKNRVLAYTCGWSRRISVSVETSTGLAISNDNGLTFEKVGHGPVFTNSSNEPFLVGDSFVKKYKGLYHMWYMFGVRWIETVDEGAQRIYKIGHATSKDGINWIKEEAKQIIPDFLNLDECQALPTVLHHKNRYHMYFCYREATRFRQDKTRGYRLGYAYSDDLINWTRDEVNTGIKYSDEGWDSEMMCYPHIFKCDEKVYLLYNGNEFGRYGFGIAVLEE
ncbi:MAG: hypothetical protein ACKO7P_10240 [Bacteroidota bacterium]